MVPLCLFVALAYPLLLSVESFDILLNNGILLLLGQYLQCSLNKRLLQLLTYRIQDPRQVPPVVHLT